MSTRVAFRRTLLLAVVLLAVVLLSGTALASGGAAPVAQGGGPGLSDASAEAQAPLQPDYLLPTGAATRFRGYVRNGTLDKPGKGIANVRVRVFGRNEGQDWPGQLIQLRTSDGSGFWNLYVLPEQKYSFDYYRVVLDVPEGLVGGGIWSEDGVVIDDHTIEYHQPGGPNDFVHENLVYYTLPAFELTLLHNNDGESKLINAGQGLEDYGGIARFTTLIKNLESTAANGPFPMPQAQARGVVKIMSGDNFLAGPEFDASLEKGVPFYDAIAHDAINFDAIDLGNHDFDFGPDVTADYMESFQPGGETFLAANLDFSGEARLQSLVDAGRLAPSVLVEKNGVKIGIIGVVPPELESISSPRNVRVIPDLPVVVQEQIDDLQAQGAKIIILTTQLQTIQNDVALVPQLSGIDIVVSGGGDEVLGDANDLYVPGDETNIYGTYPLWATSADGHQVPVVTTAGDYKYVGRLVAGFNADGDLLTVDDGVSQMVRVADVALPDGVPADALVQTNVVDPVVAYTSGLAQEIIGQSAVGLDGSRPNVRISETNLGNLLADALLWQARQMATDYDVPTPDVALQNGGGIRNNNVLPAGPFSLLSSYSVAPFSNFVAVVPVVTPAEFKLVLENAYSRIEAVDGRFAQISGFQVVVDTSMPPLTRNADGTIATTGERVRRVVLADGTVMVADGQIAATARDLSVATIDFLARGGDQYPLPAPFTRMGATYRQALANYVELALEGEITAAQYPEGGAGRILIDPAAAYTLGLLHNNDGESKLVNAGAGLADYGGIARFATLMKDLEASAVVSGVLKVNAGDNFLVGPDFSASLDKGKPFYDALALDYLDYDAIDLGNHDFDLGPDVTADILESFQAGGETFLAANLDFSAEPRLQALVDAGRLAKSVMVEKGGVKIGVIGIVPPEMPFISTPRNVTVDPDTVAVVQGEIDSLLAGGAQIVVVATQLQTIQNDLELVTQVAGVDIVVSGGGSEVLGDAADLYVPGDETRIFGPYPMWATSMSGAMVPVVTTAGDYKYVGRFIAGFDSRGVLTSVDEAASQMVRVAGGSRPDAVQPDAYVQTNVVDPVSAYTTGLAQDIIGQSAVALDGQRTNVRSKETNVGDLMADALLWQAKELADDFGAPMPEVALQNGGGIRNNNVIPAGPISTLNTFAIAPFSNFVSISKDVTPDQLKATLENAYSRISFGDGRFAQVAGLHVTVDTSMQPMVIDNDGTITQVGERVREVMLDDGTVIVQGGAIAPTARNVNVATIDFLARGGDFYQLPPTYVTVGATYQQALSRYIETGLAGQITAAQYPEGGAGRITILP